MDIRRRIKRLEEKANAVDDESERVALEQAAREAFVHPSVFIAIYKTLEAGKLRESDWPRLEQVIAGAIERRGLPARSLTDTLP